MIPWYDTAKDTGATNPIILCYATFLVCSLLYYVFVKPGGILFGKFSRDKCFFNGLVVAQGAALVAYMQGRG
jgi:hypothetical protein